MLEKSKEVIVKAKGDKNILQQIRLIINVIAPDNLKKKFEELRRLMFGQLKFKGEEGYDPDQDINMEQMNEENLGKIVERIFEKAQNEQQYCTFYGDLCERIIRLELNIRGQEAKQKTIKNSVFRKVLLDNCKKSFYNFFSEDIREKKAAMDHDKLLGYKHKLFGSKCIRVNSV